MDARRLLKLTLAKHGAHSQGPQSVAVNARGTTAPETPKNPGNPATNAKGPIKSVVRNLVPGDDAMPHKQKKKASGLDAFLEKTASQVKLGAPRPGRLDGDITLSKLAKICKNPAKLKVKA